MKANLRIAAKFNDEISAKYGGSTLEEAIIIDDAANLMHQVRIEYAEKDDQLYRRLNYTITAMQTMKTVLTTQNEMAEQLLTKVALTLGGGASLGPGRQFEVGMLKAGKDSNGVPLVWDDVLPTDKPATKKKAAK